MEHKFDIKQMEYKPVAKKQESIIVKICKKHGELTKEMTCLRKNRKGILNVILCHTCVIDGHRRSYKNNKEK